MRKMLALAVLLAVFVILPATLSAGSITFTPGTTGVDYAINSDGFFVNSADLYGAHAIASGTSLSASGSSYSDAGYALFFNGGLTLGQLLGVTVNSTGSPLAVNLWLNTSGDGKLFSFGGLSGYEFTGLNGDSYAGCGAPPTGSSSSCYMLGGNGAGGTYTLAQLQAGQVPGISASTPVAIWTGIINAGGQTVSANVSDITVNTAGAVPEPASMMLLGAGLIGLVGIARRRLRQQ